MRIDSQVKIGAILSYVLIILNVLYGLFLTPYIIATLGQDEYGVYKIIASLSASLMVLDLGLGGTVQRYVANFIAQNIKEKIGDFVGSTLIFAAFLNLVIIVVGFVVYYCLDKVYAATLSFDQLVVAKQLFIVLILILLFTVFENVLNGVITGYNRFLFGNGIKLLSLLLKILMIFVLLKIYSKAITLVYIGLFISLLVVVIEVIYIRFKLNLFICFKSFDKTILKEAGVYTILMFLTSVSSQIFSNVDNIVIGAICSPALVTVYSIGLLFFSMFQNLSAGVASVMLPTVIKTLSTDDANYTETIELIKKVGKFQFALLGAALTGFVCIGKDFIQIWLGSGYEDVYFITIVLIVPAIFELCINVCHSILRAINKLKFRTLCVFISAVLNAVLTVVLVKCYSYKGAAISTALSYILCSLIVMNVYYIRVIKLPILKIYKSIFAKIVPCLIVSGLALYVFSRFIYGSWFSIILDIIFFGVIYGFCLLTFGLTKDEIKSILSFKR